MGGIEPTTLGLLDPRSNQLSYIGLRIKLVDQIMSNLQHKLPQ